MKFSPHEIFSESAVKLHVSTTPKSKNGRNLQQTEGQPFHGNRDPSIIIIDAVCNEARQGDEKGAACRRRASGHDIVEGHGQ